MTFPRSNEAHTNMPARFWGAAVRIMHRSVTLGLLVLGGCAIATPYKVITAPADSSDSVVVALTWASVDPSRRAIFDRYVDRLVDILPQQPGLLGYSLRRELFGNDAWTMTVWSSDEARRAFVHSPLHQEAIMVSYAALTKARFSRLSMPASDLPPAWDKALAILNESQNGY